MHRLVKFNPRWVKAKDGTHHAVRQSEGEHHSCLCGKYVRSIEVFADAIYLPRRCPECVDRVAQPVPVADGDLEAGAMRNEHKTDKRRNGRIGK